METNKLNKKTLLITTILLLTMINGASAYTENLVACWSFDEDYDADIGGYNGTNEGASINTTDKMVGSGSLYCGTGNNYVVVDDSDDLEGFGNVTIIAWAKKSGDGWGNIVGKSWTAWDLGFRDWNNNIFWNHYGSDLHLEVSNSHNTWLQIAAVSDVTNDIKLLYVNGTYRINHSLSSGEGTNNYDVNFCRRPDEQRYLTGYIDEVMIFDRVLTSSEIDEIFNEGEGITCSSLISELEPEIPIVDGVDFCTETSYTTPGNLDYVYFCGKDHIINGTGQVNIHGFSELGTEGSDTGSMSSFW
jgi:hypothetical protein